MSETVASFASRMDAQDDQHLAGLVDLLLADLAMFRRVVLAEGDIDNAIAELSADAQVACLYYGFMVAMLAALRKIDEAVTR